MRPKWYERINWLQVVITVGAVLTPLANYAIDVHTQLKTVVAQQVEQDIRFDEHISVFEHHTEQISARVSKVENTAAANTQFQSEVLRRLDRIENKLDR